MRTSSSRHGAPMAKSPLTNVLAALALAGLVAACSNGGSSDDGDSAASSDRDLSAAEEASFETESEFARCMRDHGIEGLPDPQIGEDGFMLVGVPFDPTDEDWSAAQEACQPVVDDAASPDESADAAGWEQVVPGGDCQCSDGSEFSFWVREANPSKVVFYLQDGGACFSAAMCDPDSELYNTTVTGGPTEQGGIFDFADERNPFADYSAVYVPYCTGDVFMGNATTAYTPDLTIQHKGYVDGTAALDHLATTFPDATDVVVIGESAGSVAAPLYGGLASDRLPDARITVLADGSGSYPDAPELTDLVADAWGTGNAIPDWPENAGVTAEQWSSFPGLFVQSGRHDPNIVFARHDYAYDEQQTSRLSAVGVPTDDLLGLIDANETQIEDAGVNLLSYIAPGDEHTVLSDGLFYTEEVNDQLLVDWATKLIAGEPVDDVHCDQCAPG
jgi:hypothetical protein